MKSKIRIDGYTFELNKDCEMYECRGEVCYNDEHDEIPEEGLWKAAVKLAKKLKLEGNPFAREDWSEKGWVEVHI